MGRKISTPVQLREWWRFVVLLFSAIVATLVFRPCAAIFPKKKGRVAILGRESGSFSDNAKHFFLFAQKYQGGYFSVAFISSKKSTVAELRDHFFSTLHYPGLRAIFWLISAEFVIMDSAEWISGGKYQLAASGKLVQIWHGAPLKEIELPLHQRRLARLDFLSRLFLQFQKKITGRYPDHFAVVSTSKFFTKRAFSWHSGRVIMSRPDIPGTMPSLRGKEICPGLPPFG